MSIPLPPRSPGSHATKQLLDELDALMQRMLELPVNELGDDLGEGAKDSAAEEAPDATATATVPPPPTVDRPEATAAADSVSGVPEVLGTRLISPHPASSSLPPPHWQVGTPAVPTPKEENAPRSESAAFPPAGFWPHPALQAPVDQGAAPPEPPHKASPPRPPNLPPPRRPAFFSNRTAPAPRRLAGWWLRSLLWSNRTFDHYTFWLGRPGRWLQGRTGRAMLGWLGLGLLGAALVWCLSNWFGWTW
jgi:hypothetical protein